MVSTQPINVRVRMSLSTLEHANLLPLVRAIARQYGCTVEAIVGDRRHKSITHARQAAWYAVYHHGDRSFSYPEIGRMFNRDHTTVMSGCARHAERIAEGSAVVFAPPLEGRAAAEWPDCLPPMLDAATIVAATPACQAELPCIPPLFDEPLPIKGLQRAVSAMHEEQVCVA